MVKIGADAIVEACKMGFFAGFKRCKQMAQAFLPNNGAKILKINPSNGSLKAMVDDRIKALPKFLSEFSM